MGLLLVVLLPVQVGFGSVNHLKKEKVESMGTCFERSGAPRILENMESANQFNIEDHIICIRNNSYIL